jgi:hypothetical protein
MLKVDWMHFGDKYFKRFKALLDEHVLGKPLGSNPYF